MSANRLHRVREVKEFLGSKIIEEAQLEGVPLSEVERKMLFFSEVGWTLPDMKEVSDAFDREYDQDDYERKITGLIERFDKRIRSENPSEYDEWHAAIRFLKPKDHYINVMISQALPRLRPRGDRMKLWLTGFAIVAAFLCVVFLSAKYGIDLNQYLPRRGDFQNLFIWIWLAAIASVILYYLLRLALGAARLNHLIGVFIGKLFRVQEHED